MRRCHLRFATPDDAGTLLRFIEALATYEREPDAVEVTEATLRSQLSAPSPPFECLLAEVGGAPVGMALFFTTYSTWRGAPGLYLEDLWVDPSARRRGVARQLVARLAALTLERGGRRLEWAVLNWNELALGFYRGLDATALDGWTTMRLDGDALSKLAGED
jgi:GNAT superfamily N-acetyltransferase